MSVDLTFNKRIYLKELSQELGSEWDNMMATEPYFNVWDIRRNNENGTYYLCGGKAISFPEMFWDYCEKHNIKCTTDETELYQLWVRCQYIKNEESVDALYELMFDNDLTPEQTNDVFNHVCNHVLPNIKVEDMDLPF